jgi:hypothetical protein
MVSLQSAVSTHPGPRFTSVALSMPAQVSTPTSVPPVLNGPPTPMRPEGLIEIVLPSGVSVRVDAQVDRRALRRVLVALEDR